MFFNSIDFAVFLPVVFLLYWFVFQGQLRLQNLLIVTASYVFYGWWDWRFLSLIFISTLVDYSIGLALKNQNQITKRKILLGLSIFINLGFLGFFKYYNFFIENFIRAYSFFGFNFQIDTLKIILPIGISFYTFQTLSYTIDIYRKKLEPTKDFIAFLAFVSFFPQLVAGPIEKAAHLLPQFYKKRFFDLSKATDGMRQILWGLFKKIVIADKCAEYVNIVFNSPENYSGSTLILGAVFFSFQIYGDFSGYSDIAIGTSRLFGFDLTRNFAFPYFSRDIAEFWRRWHISLSSWFKDYLYIPLGGSHGNTWIKIRNTFIIFLVSGFWHGANWTFIIWGGLNALYFLPILLSNNNRKNLEIVAKNKYFPTFKEFFLICFTFGQVVFAWIFFRAESLPHAWRYIKNIFSFSLFTMPKIPEASGVTLTLILILIFIFIEWQAREHQHALENLELKLKKPYRYAFYYGLIIAIFWFSGKEQQFIYFQF